MILFRDYSNLYYFMLTVVVLFMRLSFYMVIDDTFLRASDARRWAINDGSWRDARSTIARMAAG